VSNKQILSQEFESLKIDLIKLYDAKGMRASGKWADSLEVIANENTVVLMGEEYSQQLETGRKEGRFPPIADIKKWILDKGVFASALQNISLSSLAFLIARKIANNGWKRERFGGVELISSVITGERMQKIIDEVGNVMMVQISSEIITLINELEAA
jgi:hypothetical protein